MKAQFLAAVEIDVIDLLGSLDIVMRHRLLMILLGDLEFNEKLTSVELDAVHKVMGLVNKSENGRFEPYNSDFLSTIVKNFKPKT
jgi:hypothetical protein